MTYQSVSSTSIIGTPVTNTQEENLGKIEDVMINYTDGEVAYLVLSYGGIFGTSFANKLFAVPFSALTPKQTGDDADDISYLLNSTKDQLSDAPGFDKDNWPDFADSTFRTNLNNYYSPNRKAA